MTHQAPPRPPSHSATRGPSGRGHARRPRKTGAPARSPVACATRSSIQITSASETDAGRFPRMVTRSSSNCSRYRSSQHSRYVLGPSPIRAASSRSSCKRPIRSIRSWINSGRVAGSHVVPSMCSNARPPYDVSGTSSQPRTRGAPVLSFQPFVDGEPASHLARIGRELHVDGALAVADLEGLGDEAAPVQHTLGASTYRTGVRTETPGTATCRRSAGRDRSRSSLAAE